MRCWLYFVRNFSMWKFQYEKIKTDLFWGYEIRHKS